VICTIDYACWLWDLVLHYFETILKKLKEAAKILSKYDICYTDADTCIIIPTTAERILLTATYYSGTLLHP
jgi:hypothetical protein